MFGKKEEKKLFIGVGVSENKDPSIAAKEAAEAALGNLQGKSPTISYTFYAGEYDPYSLCSALKKSLLDTEFVGGSAPSFFNDDKIYHQGVIVISVYSDFLHIGVASAENLQNNPLKISKKTAENALKKIKLDKYVDPYLQFSRLKEGNIQGIIKIPTFTLHVFTRGFKLNGAGREVDVIEGISNVLGQYAPIFGGSLGVPLQKVFNHEPYEVFAFHSGKVMKDGIVLIVMNSGLIYSNSISHGCKPTDKMGFVTKVDLNGYALSKVSDMPTVEWYAKQIGVSVEEFTKNNLVYTQKHPIAIPNGEGGYVLRAGGEIFKDGGMGFVAPFSVGLPVIIMDGSEKNMMTASEDIKKDIDEHLHHKLIPAFGLGVLCVSREIILKEKMANELKMLKSNLKLKNGIFAGFLSFGEIGAKPGKTCTFNHLTDNVFLLYDKMITDLPK